VYKPSFGDSVPFIRLVVEKGLSREQAPFTPAWKATVSQEEGNDDHEDNYLQQSFLSVKVTQYPMKHPSNIASA
jgi:hypothetical protein